MSHRSQFATTFLSLFASLATSSIASATTPSCEVAATTFGSVPPAILTEKQKSMHEHLVARLRKLSEHDPVETRQVRADNEADFIRVQGVPKTAVFIDGPELGLVRHYSYHAQAIIKEKILRAGPRPYVAPAAHEIRWYEDLTGVMVTSIKCHPSELLMGLSADSVGFIDFKLPAGVTVLKLDKCNFLIPGNAAWPQWMVQEFTKFRDAGSPPELSKPYYSVLKHAGPDLGPFELPITPVYHRPELRPAR